MDETFFTGLKIEPVELATGVRIGLPMQYRDWSAIMAHFPAPAAEVQKLLPTRKLQPALLRPGTAVVTMVAYEYRQISDTPPYNEFAISVPALHNPAVNVPGLPLLFPHWFKGFGHYVYQLPVTRQEAVDFGIEFWGYPKFVAEICFEEENDLRRCRLRADGKDIVTLEVKKLAVRANAMSYYTFTVKDGQLLKSLVQLQGQYGVARNRGGASYILGDHPIAEVLRSLGIGKTAVERMYVSQAQSIVHSAGIHLSL